MASTYGYPNFTPNPTRAIVVVTPPTLWWCTNLQNPFLPLNYLTLDPPDINTYVRMEGYTCMFESDDICDLFFLSIITHKLNIIDIT